MIKSKLLTFLLLILIGCAPVPNKGRITNKHTARHEKTVTWTFITTDAGTIQTQIPIAIEHPAYTKYYITYDGFDRNGKKHTIDVEVPPAIFNKYNVGDVYQGAK